MFDKHLDELHMGMAAQPRGYDTRKHVDAHTRMHAHRLEDSDMLYKSRKLALCARQPPSDWSWPALDEDAAAALCAACRRIQDAEHVSGAWQCLTFRG